MTRLLSSITLLLLLLACYLSNISLGSTSGMQPFLPRNLANVQTGSEAADQDHALHHEPDLIALERRGAAEGCPQYDLRIWANGDVEFRGIANVADLGSHRATVEPEVAQFLFRCADYIEFEKFAPAYSEEVSDVWTTTLSIKRNGITHTVLNRWSFAISVYEPSPNEKQHLLLDYYATTIERLAIDSTWLAPLPPSSESTPVDSNK